jgi:hypothetical protein
MSVAQETGASFAQLCFQHTYAGCGCGMCQPGDICPTPILKVSDVTIDETQLPVRSAGLLDRTLIEDSR